MDEGDRLTGKPPGPVAVFRQRAAEVIRAASKPCRGLGQQPGT